MSTSSTTTTTASSRATQLADRITPAFTAGDVDAFVACFAEDAVQTHSIFPAPNHGREAIRAAEGAMFAAFDDISFEVTNLVDGGEWVAMEHRVGATNTGDLTMPDGTAVPATGKRIEMMEASLCRLDADGLIAEEHRYADVMGFLAQLGLVG